MTMEIHVSCWMFLLLVVPLMVKCDDEEVVTNLTVSPKFLLLEHGEAGIVRVMFNINAPDFKCIFRCDELQLPYNPKSKYREDSLSQDVCWYSLTSDVNSTRNCSCDVIAMISEDNERKTSVDFTVAKSIKLNSEPSIAWKGFEIDFGLVHHRYPEPVTCKFERLDERYHQDNCRLMIGNTERQDAGIHNFTLCLEKFPEGCVNGSMTLIVLEAKMNSSSLAVTVSGVTPEEDLTILCSEGCVNPEPTARESDETDGLCHVMWDNVTDSQIIQVYSKDSNILLYNGTVKFLQKPSLPQLQNNTILVPIVCSSLVLPAIAVGVVIYCYKKKQRDARRGNTSSYPLHTVGNDIGEGDTSGDPLRGEGIETEMRVIGGEAEGQPLNVANGH